MYISDIVNFINGNVLNNLNLQKTFNKICTNSKEVEENDIFIALSGLNFDGHDFISEVTIKKPAAIIVSKIINGKFDIPIIMVDNTNKALMDIGSLYRSKFSGKVIAVTGSSGKTMTKELIYNILSKKYKVLKSDGNKNNHIGLPLTLTKLDNNYDFAVLEMGMNHKKEISSLSTISKPDIAVITNIGTSHIGNLGSKRNIFKAKLEITDGIKNGTLVVNGNDRYLNKLKSNKNITVIKCGTKNKEFLTNLIVGENKTIFFINHDNKEYKFILNMPGKYLVTNCLLAIKIGLINNIDIEDIIDSINEYIPLHNRLNVIKIDSNILIDDCYNSNYESVLSIINHLKIYKQHKIVILGDILELGKYSKKIHKKIGKILKKNNFNELLFAGKYMYYAYKQNKNSKYFIDNNDIIEYLKTKNIQNSVILVKASRGMYFEKISDFFKEKISKQ